MNALAEQVDGVQANQESYPGQINITVKVYTQKQVNTIQINLELNTSFQDLIAYVTMKIFSSNLRNQFEELIQYKFGQRIIAPTETRTVGQLGMKNGSELDMRMNLKGGLDSVPHQLNEPVINVSVRVHCFIEQPVRFKFNFESKLKFKQLVESLWERIFKQSIVNQMKNSVRYQIGEQLIQRDESRTIYELGLEDEWLDIKF